MKRLSFLFTIGSIAVVSLLSSCKKDSKTDPIPAPTVSAGFFGVSGSNAIAPSGTAVKINYTASAAEGLQSITATAKYGTTTVNVWPAKTSGFKTSTSDDATVNYTSPSSDEVVITITVIDKKSQTSTATLTLNKSMAINLSLATVTLLGGQNNTVGQFYATSNKTVYTIANAKTNATIIDLVHSHRNTAAGNHIISGAGDANALAVYDAAGPDKLSTWSTKNAVAFMVITAAQYDAAKTSDNVLDLVPEAGALTAVTNLVAGSYFAYASESGGVGVAKVTAIAGTDFSATNSSITLELKVATEM